MRYVLHAYTLMALYRNEEDEWHEEGAGDAVAVSMVALVAV